MPEPISDALVRIDAASRALAEARDLVKVKEVRDQAQAILSYIKQQKAGVEAQIAGSVLKVRAERRLGELLGETVSPGRPGKLSHDVTFLPDDITRMQSHRWQRIASIPSDVFEEEILKTVDGRRELTTSALLKLAKQLSRRPEESSDDNEPGCAISELDGLVADGRKFGTIYIDPPWQYDNRGTRAAAEDHYGTMTVEEIAALPVDTLAADKSHLHLWTTDSFFEDAIRLLRGWGFERRQTFVWVKPQLGIGNYWRSSHEYMLLGVRGGLTFPPTDIKSWISHDRTRHSAKPEEVRMLIERVSPAPRLEMFARVLSPGWVSWGNQISRDLFTKSVESMTESGYEQKASDIEEEATGFAFTE